MTDFLDVANDLLRTKQVEDKRLHFDRVFNAIGELQSVHSKAQLDLNNIESVFNALELGRIIQRVPGIDTAEIPKVIASLRELIVKTLETTIVFPTAASYIGVPRPYEAFAGLIKHLRSQASPVQTVSVVTFNYDIAADMALYRAGFGPDYVIESDPRSRDQVRLLKLHGSLNWATEKVSRKIRPLHLSDYLQRYTIPGFTGQFGEAKVPIGAQLAEYFLKYGSLVEVEPEPVIVPPSWNKADYHQTLSNVWAAAADDLSKAEYIFVIGYSLPETDSLFRHLYALGSVGKSGLRKIIVYNPEKLIDGGVDARFRALLGPGAIARYDYQQMTFEAAIEDMKLWFPSRK